MKIIDVSVKLFVTQTNQMKDSDGHTHPGPWREARQAMLTIACDDGTAGRVIVSPADVREDLLAAYVRPVLVGADPLRIESLWYGLYKWQRGSAWRLGDRTLCAVDLALHDLLGQATRPPVWKLLGGYRDKILAYASTMCGDDVENGLATAADYGRFAQWCVQTRGYKALKLHTWMPPIPGAPDVKLDYAACAAVREAVGPDIPLMLDPNHWYSRTDALWLGRRLEELGFLWMEEPMEEASLSSYQWLAQNLATLVIAQLGGVRYRNLGGITPKTGHARRMAQSSNPFWLCSAGIESSWPVGASLRRTQLSSYRRSMSSDPRPCRASTGSAPSGSRTRRATCCGQASGTSEASARR